MSAKQLVLSFPPSLPPSLSPSLPSLPLSFPPSLPPSISLSLAMTKGEAAWWVVSTSHSGHIWMRFRAAWKGRRVGGWLSWLQVQGTAKHESMCCCPKKPLSLCARQSWLRGVKDQIGTGHMQCFGEEEEGRRERVASLSPSFSPLARGERERERGKQ